MDDFQQLHIQNDYSHRFDTFVEYFCAARVRDEIEWEKNTYERDFDFSTESSAPNLAYISLCLHVALRACLPANQPTS